jgi:predicted RNA binding protein YcfA (HicA-like mRNA interferase family)
LCLSVAKTVPAYDVHLIRSHAFGRQCIQQHIQAVRATQAAREIRVFTVGKCNVISEANSNDAAAQCQAALRKGRAAHASSTVLRWLILIKALEKVGFRVLRQGKHTVMSDGVRIITIPRHNPVNAFTMGGIARDAGLSVEEFRKLL